jgi:hypothetical protein
MRSVSRAHVNLFIFSDNIILRYVLLLSVLLGLCFHLRFILQIGSSYYYFRTIQFIYAAGNDIRCRLHVVLYLFQLFKAFPLFVVIELSGVSAKSLINQRLRIPGMASSLTLS